MNVQNVITHILGKTGKGPAPAPNAVAAANRLKLQQLQQLSQEEGSPQVHKKKKFRLFASKRVTPWEVAVFTRQLAATLASGLLLSEALDAVGGELENAYFGEVIKRIRRDIHGGTSFSGALGKFPRVFPISYVAIIRSGEAVGNLDRTMASLAKFLESSEQLKEKVKNAVTYPAFIFVFAFIVTLLLVLFLIPKFQEMYEQVGAPLPYLTQIVITVSNFIIAYFPWIGVSLTLAAIVAFKIRHVPQAKKFYDLCALRIPVIGKLIIYKFIIAKFCRTLGVLLAGGVSISTALSITAEVVNHHPFTEGIENLRRRIVSGGTISTQIRALGIFPSFVAKMVAVGEKTGRIAEMLQKTADYFDDELDNTIRRLTILIEPTLIIMIGGFISVIIVALYMPIFNVAALVQ